MYSYFGDTTLASRAMNVIRHTDKAFTATIRALATQSSLFDPTIEERTRAILQNVHARGAWNLFPDRKDSLTTKNAKNAKQL